MKCSVCGNEIKETDKICSKCGLVLSNQKVHSDWITCDKCGKKLDKSDRLCLHCGNIITIDEQNSKPCRICNQPIDLEAKYCTFCGAKVDDDIEQADDLKDIIESKARENAYQNKNYFVSSLIGLIVILLFGGLSPLVFGIISIVLLVSSMLGFIKEKSRKNGWAIAFASLAILVSGFNYVNNLIAKDYALESGKRISEVIGIELDLPEPDYFDISIMNDEPSRITFTEYIFNDIIYKLKEDKALEIEAIINNSEKFTDEHIDTLTDKFEMVMLKGTDATLVYNLKTKKFELPIEFKEYDIIIINYDSDDHILQILEIKG